MRLKESRRPGEKGRVVSVQIEFWKDEHGVIRVASNDPECPDFMVAVSPDPRSTFGHPTLYKRLDAYLKQKGAAEPVA